MKKLSMKILTFLLVVSAVSTLSVNVLAQDIVTPQRYEFCTVCHGASFQGNSSIDAPNLSILSSTYIKQQLTNYKQSIRGTLPDDIIGREMQPMTLELSAEEINAIAEFVGDLPDKLAKATVEGGDVVRGRRLYAGCSACHGLKGEGNEAMKAPRLAGQNDWYLFRQLQSYKQRLRGDTPGDMPGAQMLSASQMLADDRAILDVVFYINTLAN